ncbi:MAG: DNA methyltransferase [Planctomycetes bacterium]|nr:DNA methyltransferase [Planctomycetota bacterium]
MTTSTNAETPAETTFALLPPTRYQGSKRRICGWLGLHLSALHFTTVLDAFGGTGSVSYMLKHLGKCVTYNDALAANREMATGLIENGRTVLSTSATSNLLRRITSAAGLGFISETFRGIYFTDEENDWLDGACRVIPKMGDRFQRAIAWYALFQSAISKRPYNLFHRANLNLRIADVERSFGNKVTWDRSFDEHFRHFVKQANGAVQPTCGTCVASCCDVTDIVGEFDLVYLDPPYINDKGTGVDYFGFYHFLEGMLDYEGWPARVDWSSKHRRLIGEKCRWTNKRRVAVAFEEVFERFRDSRLVISYRSDGIPSIEELVAMLRRQNRRPLVYRHDRYRYALSKNKRSSEILIVAE